MIGSIQGHTTGAGAALKLRDRTTLLTMLVGLAASASDLLGLEPRLAFKCSAVSEKVLLWPESVFRALSSKFLLPCFVTGF